MYLDMVILKDLIKGSRHQYMEITMNMLNEFIGTVELPDGIPIGDLEFVQRYLSAYKNIPQLNPIEVPSMMRRPIFLKRSYDLKHGYELPETGDYFIKDVTGLKLMTHIGNIADIKNDIIPDHLYILSDIIDIEAEYRCFFIDGRLHSINYYNGNPCKLPDVQTITSANACYSIQNDYPKSYCMDVAVTPKGTCILECHILFSCGLYTTLLGYNFLYGYQDAMRYTLEHNTRITAD